MRKLLPILLLVFVMGHVSAQDKYFRTIASGLYANPIWESGPTAASFPNGNSPSLTIASDETVIIRHSVNTWFLNSIVVNGTLIIEPGADFSPLGGFTNSSGNDGVILKSDASGSAQFLLKSSMNATREVYVTGSLWHLIGSPMDGASTTDVFDGCYMQQYHSDGTWTWNDEGGFDDTMDRGLGYSIYSPSSSTYSIEGNVTASNVSVNLVNTGGGYNLVANPFVCGLEWNGSIGRNNVDSDINIWNSVTKSYNIKSSGSYVLPALGGFMAKANGTSPSISFTASNMTVSNTGNLEKNEENTSDYFMINVQNQNNEYADAVKIAFDDGASEYYSYVLDLEKLYGSEESPDLYLMSLDGQDLVRKTLPLYLLNPLKLNLKSQVDAEYSISASDFNLSFPVDIYLEDLFEGQTVVLDEDMAYSFSSTANGNEDRFLLHFEGITGVKETGIINYAIFSSYSNLIIEAKSEKSFNVQVFNTIGQEVYNLDNCSGDQRIDLSDFRNQVLIVNVVTEDGSIAEKVMIK
ncbi:T9SS type A sorting domain-containing protein [Lentimicrobium sp. S6]|uniref:T9SS type A sorting domain-containing protein n=1 Tax=Lentimicrobium sp. S6 TaxID=2735872 RepID=UPI001557AD01|nr:T9SS type A sorting domain-containing protein [Lentimicrobium sp. S6]NPD46241.1 T9SS type A sorting domain-containing protein [Lentimicrobium sp. S6]